MKGRRAAIVLGMFVGALATQGLSAGDNDRAVPRGGGSSGGGGSRGGGGGGGSSAASRHPSSGGGGSSYSGGSSSGSAYSRGPQTGAQRRQPVPGQGHYGHGHDGYYYGHGHGYYGGYYPYYPYYSYWPYWGWGYGYGYYSPWYYPYNGFYAGFGYPYYGVGVAYSGGGGEYYGGASYEAAGSVRLLVEPVETKVYVDGYYAGKVDDFDGMFQRLNLRPGAHDILLKLDGYETHKIKLYVPLDHTLKVRHDMARGAADHVTEQTVGDPADAQRYARQERVREPEYRPEGEEDERASQPRMRVEEGERRADESGAGREQRGTVRLDVTPVDASIYVDGMFRGTGQDLRRLNLPVGRHRLEVVRPGYRTLERDLEVQSGETEQVQVDLPRS